MCVCVSDQLLLLLVLPRHSSHVRRISIGIPTVCERQINAHVLLSGEKGGSSWLLVENRGRREASEGYFDITLPQINLLVVWSEQQFRFMR